MAGANREDVDRPVRARPRRRQGQVMVIFALALTALLAAAGLAFDIGRFYSERRFLQNAADAAALAAANALIRGDTVVQADAEARDILTRNFLSSPSGVPPALPPASGSEVYESGHAGDPTYLLNGILIQGNEVRVAVQNPVNYTFGRIVGLTSSSIGGQALVTTVGDLLPIAIRHYINAPGPTTGAAYPCDGDIRDFQDLVSTADTACLGTEADASLRTAPTRGAVFNALNPNDDPSHHGPIISLIGQNAQPSNASSFRGFITLDIRNFYSSTPPSNVFYNNVPYGVTANVLAAFEAAWVKDGYRGPDFPAATVPPDPNDQVGILDGNKSGIIIDALDNRYSPGDEIMSAVYSGTVMTIPDFSLTVAGTIPIGQTQNRNGLVTMTATKNAAFTGVIVPSVIADWGDPSSPYGTSLSPLTLTPTPATPPTTITWATFNTTAAPVGVYTIWIKGFSPSPYLIDHYYPVAINIGAVSRDFSSDGSGLIIPVTTTGSTGTGTMTFSTPNNGSTFFGGTVNLTLEGGPESLGVLPTGIGATSISPSSFVLNKGESQAVTISINGGTLGPGLYPLTIRATGTNSAGQTVTRLVPIVFDVATGSTATEYVDIMGFAVFRIVSVNSNEIDGYAISRVYADMNDPNLRIGQVARLVPWN